MAHLYIPLDGVPIVPSPPAATYIAADGWVVFSLSDRRFYAYNLALGIWQQAGGGVIVADTDSVDLTDTSSTLTADVRISSDIAPVGSVKATITIQTGANPGLLAVVSEADIKALFSVADTNSVDLTYFSGQTTADVRISANAADAGYQLVPINIESTSSKGLRAQISNAAIQSALSVTDSNSIDLSYSSGAMSGDVLLSAAAADAGSTKVNLDIQSGVNKGIRAQIANSAIQAAVSVTDTNSVDMTYTAGALSSDVRLSNNAASASNQLVDLNIESTGTVGLRAQIPNSRIQAAISVTDTNSLDLSYSSGAVSGDVRISSNAADSGYTIVGLSTQSTGVVGLRAQIQNTAVYGLFSATAPVQYSNTTGAFSFDTATTTLTAYLLKTGGTMTGQITNSSGFTNTGLSTGCLQPSTAHNVLNLQSTAITFDTTVTQFFRIALSLANHPGIVFECSRHTADIVVLTDVENLFLESDAGTGVYIWKSAVSGIVNIKSRLGSTHNIAVIIERGLVSSATAWA